jgi:serine/threonine protein kinase
MNYEKKYLKYKNKYINLHQNISKIGGGIDLDVAKQTLIDQAVISARETGKSQQYIDTIIANPTTIKPYNITKCNTLDEPIECPLPINKKPSEVSTWRLIKKLSSHGAEGEIYLGYLNNPREVKIIKYVNIINLPLPEAAQQIKNEVCLQNIAALFNIAPRIYDYWLCEERNTAVIVMDKGGDFTLANYLNQIKLILDTPLDNNHKIKHVCNLYFAYKLIIMKLIKLNHNYILHLDLHLENILVSVNDDNNVIDVHIIDYGKSRRLDLISLEAGRQINIYIEGGNIINNALGLAHYATLVSKDYFAMLKNETNGILVYLSDYKRNSFRDKLIEFCNTLDINSIYYYYMLLVISKELTLITERGGFYENVNDTIENMYEVDIDGIIQEISTLIKLDINYLISFGVQFINSIDDINARLDEFDEVNIAELKEAIFEKYTQILHITTQL